MEKKEKLRLPEILILDEPSEGLDPISKEGLFSNIKKYHKKQGNTVILVSHNMQDVAMLSDKIVVMNNGKVCMFDTPQNIFKQANVLEDIGLCVPDITKIMLKIKNKGFTYQGGKQNAEDSRGKMARTRRTGSEERFGDTRGGTF